MLALEDLTVLDPKTLNKVPADGETIGEVMVPGQCGYEGVSKKPQCHQRSI